MSTDNSTVLISEGGEAVNCVKEEEKEEKSLSFLDRFLTIWIILAAALGFGLSYIPGLPEGIEKCEVDGTNVLLAVGLILMMWPPLSRVHYDQLGDVFRDWKSLGLSIVLNWIVGPFMMYFLAAATVFDKSELMHGVSMVGCARCIAMVVVWNALADGDGELCAVLVAVNTILSLFLYAPYVVFFTDTLPRAMGMDGMGDAFDDTSELWILVVKSVAVYQAVPFALGFISWYMIGKRPNNLEWYYNVFVVKTGPIALLSLLFTIVLIFAQNGSHVVEYIELVFRAAVPLCCYYVLMFVGSYYAAMWVSGPGGHEAATAMAFTAASNNFELALAVALAIFSLNSQGALSAISGVLFEIPVMLALVHVAVWLKPKDGNDEENEQLQGKTELATVKS